MLGTGGGGLPPLAGCCAAPGGANQRRGAGGSRHPGYLEHAHLAAQVRPQQGASWPPTPNYPRNGPSYWRRSLTPPPAGRVQCCPPETLVKVAQIQQKSVMVEGVKVVRQSSVAGESAPGAGGVEWSGECTGCRVQGAGCRLALPTGGLGLQPP